MTSKLVLIQGRFTEQQKAVLDAIREDLRHRNSLPVMFDFDPPVSRDLTETVRILAHIARYVIADITDPRSIPQELTSIIPYLPSVPVQAGNDRSNLGNASGYYFSVRSRLMRERRGAIRRLVARSDDGARRLSASQRQYPCRVVAPLWSPVNPCQAIDDNANRDSRRYKIEGSDGAIPR